MADNINILVPKESIDSIIAADKAITNLDVVYRKMIDGIAQGNKMFKEAGETLENLKKGQEATKKQSEEIDAIGKKLLATEQQLKNLEDERTKTIMANEQAIKERRKQIMEEVQATKIQEGSIAALRAENKKLATERDNVNTKTAEGKKRIMELNTMIDKNTETIRANSDAAAKQKMNIGNYKSALEGLPGPLGNVATTATTATTSLKALSKVPLVAAIAAIIGIFAGLFRAFKSTEEGGDRVAVIMGKIKGVLDVLKQAAQGVSLALADLLSGRFRQAGDHLKDAFGGIGQRMVSAAKQGGVLAKTLDDIADEKLAYNIDAIREKISELYREAGDRSLGANVRAEKFREAIKLTEELYGKQIDWSKRAADAEIGYTVERFKVSKEELIKFLYADEQARNQMIEGNQDLANVRESLNNQGLAELRDKLTEENRLRADFNSETRRMYGQMKNQETTFAREAAEEKKKIEEAFAERVTKIAEEQYNVRIAFQEKLIEEQKALDEELVKMLEDDLSRMEVMQNDYLKANLDNIEKARLDELADLERAKNEKLISEQDYQEKRAEINIRFTKKMVSEQIDQLNGLLMTSNLTVDERADAEKRLADLRLQLEEEIAKTSHDNLQKWIKDNEAAIGASVDLVSELGNAIFEISNNRIEAEMADIERKRDLEIDAAGDSKEEQKRINEKYDKELARVKSEQAKNDRNAALFNIAINTASAAVKGLAEGGPLLMALYLALGAIQAGVVLAKPIPKFAKGTFGKYDTPSTFLAGEAGEELLQNKAGDIIQVNRPTLFTGAKGMRVYSNRELKDIDRMMASRAVDDRDAAELRAIRSELGKVNRSLANQKQYIMQNGKAIGYRRGGYQRVYVERMIGGRS